jgi:hypothetical protein
MRYPRLRRKREMIRYRVWITRVALLASFVLASGAMDKWNQ